MTTAHRPTFDPARGKQALTGEGYHQRLLPAHKTLKFRQATQGTPDEQSQRNLVAELLRKEAKHAALKEGRELPPDDDDAIVPKTTDTPIPALPAPQGTKRPLPDPTPSEDPETETPSAKKQRVLAETHAIDAASDSDSRSSRASSPSSAGDSSSESDSDSDDEEDALQRELQRIHAERAAKSAAQAAAQAAKDEEAREREIAMGNPLLNNRGTGSGEGAQFGVKRRWDDDVVFRNQARGTEEKGKGRGFVNDLLRSDFHRKFMDKYVR